MEKSNIVYVYKKNGVIFSRDSSGVWRYDIANPGDVYKKNYQDKQGYDTLEYAPQKIKAKFFIVLGAFVEKTTQYCMESYGDIGKRLLELESLKANNNEN